MNWKFNNDKIVVTTNNPFSGKILTGCLSVFAIAIIGIAVIAGLAFYVAGESTFDKISSVILSSLGAIFGLILLITMRTHSKNKFIRELNFDKNNESIKFTEDTIILAEFTFTSVTGIKVVKEIRSRNSSSSSGNSSYPVWLVYLIKNDGAFFWVDTFMEEEEAITNSKRISVLLDLDNIDRKKGVETERSFPVSQGKFVNTKETSKGLEISLFQEKSFSDKIVVILVFLLFLGVISLLLSYAIRSFIVDGDSIFLFFLIPFSILFVTILLFFLLYSVVKQTKLTVNSGELIISYDFGLSLITKLLGKPRIIPSNVIRYIRVNQLENNSFWLSAVVDSKFEIDTLDKLHDMVSGFSNEELKINESEKLISLMLVFGIKKLTNAPSYNDLIYIEQLIENKLVLREKLI
jgi:hypothetical protein